MTGLASRKRVLRISHFPHPTTNAATLRSAGQEGPIRRARNDLEISSSHKEASDLSGWSGSDRVEQLSGPPQ